MHILGVKQCRNPMDHYIALGGMIGFTPSPEELESLGRDRFDYLRATAFHALKNGDYTPLLLNPLPGEQPDPRTS